MSKFKPLSINNIANANVIHWLILVKEKFNLDFIKCLLEIIRLKTGIVPIPNKNINSAPKLDE